MKTPLRAWCLLLCTILSPVVANGQDAPPLRDAALMTMSAYTKGLRGDFFYSGAVDDQIGIGMSIPDASRRLDDGTWLVSGCRHGNCTEKAAIIATSGGEALAAAILHYECSKKNAAKDCLGRPILTIFVRSFVNSPSVPRNLQDWARKELAQYKNYHPLRMTKIQILRR